MNFSRIFCCQGSTPRGKPQFDGLKIHIFTPNTLRCAFFSPQIPPFTHLSGDLSRVGANRASCGGTDGGLNSEHSVMCELLRKLKPSDLVAVNFFCPRPDAHWHPRNWVSSLSFDQFLSVLDFSVDRDYNQIPFKIHFQHEIV